MSNVAREHKFDPRTQRCIHCRIDLIAMAERRSETCGVEIITSEFDLRGFAAMRVGSNV